jgi:DNA-binding LacI/PurR family transcriptional regulator
METKKAPTIRDVALLAQVSIATVSNVLSNRSSVNPELAERVRAAVRELGYEVHRFASQLRSGKSHVVTVLVPSLENPFFTAIIASIEHHSSSLGYDIIVASSNGDEEIERGRLSALLSWRPLGAVIVPCNDAFEPRAVLESADVPYVVADRVVEEASEVDAVTVDNRAGAGLAARHLVDLGHRDLLVIASSLSLANIRQRCAGIQDVIARAGLPEPTVLECGFTFETVTEQLGSWLEQHPCPTGIIALTNFGTLGVMAALSQRSIRIPDQVSLVGFDDYIWMRAASPSITAVRQPVEEIGAQAMKLLHARIRGDGGPRSRVRLACELIGRSSTRSIAAPGIRSPTGSRRAAKAAPRRKGRGQP